MRRVSLIDGKTKDLTGAVAACIARVILWIAPITQEYGTVNPRDGEEGGVADLEEDVLFGVFSDLPTKVDVPP